MKDKHFNILTNRIKFSKKALILCTFLCISVIANSEPFFSGVAGIGGRIQPVTDSIIPTTLVDAYFAGQFDLSQSVILRSSFSMYTVDSIFGDNLMNNTPSYFNLDELSFTYRGFIGTISHFLSAYIGEYDPVGSDVFLQRQFGIPSFSSKLTESICGVSKAKIYDMSCIGGSYLIRFPQNLALGIYAYYNKGPDWTQLTMGATEAEIEAADDVESINTDLRFAGAWQSVNLDIAVGLTLPIEKEIVSGANTEKVLLLIRRADMHAGITAYFGGSNSSSLLFQAGFTKLIIDPQQLTQEQALSFDNIYVLIEPRFVTSKICFSLSLFNMPLSVSDNLFYIKDPLGVSVSLYTPWLSLGGKKSQFGVMGTMSCQENLTNLIIDTNLLKENLRLFVSPYGIIHLGGGKLNFSVLSNVFAISNWDTFVANTSLMMGYKVQL